MIVYGVDPGTERSAVVLYNGESVALHVELQNEEVLNSLRMPSNEAVLVIEKIESFGMAVGAETFETVFWSGRFAQVWTPRKFDRLSRRAIKLHLCHSGRATDANIRQALIDRFGPTTEKAIGSKKAPGPLYGIKSHCWAALAVAVTWWDQNGHLPAEVRPGVRAEF